MKKIMFGIFAHPDDESFGPVGTLLVEKTAGNAVHLICATAGEAGNNPYNHGNLGSTRREEWAAAGKLICADSMTMLGYHDGYLKNNDFLPWLRQSSPKLMSCWSTSARDHRNDRCVTVS